LYTSIYQEVKMSDLFNYLIFLTLKYALRRS